MDKLEHYRQVLQSIILRYANYKPRYSQVEWLPICDTLRDEYLLLKVGWEKGEKHIYHPIFHFRLHNGKVYVEADNTDAEPVQEMLDAGIPHSDIVLAFHAPSYREFTDFAVA